MTLFKHTEPPKESGWYLMEDNNGDREVYFFDSTSNEWIVDGIVIDAYCHYSPSPPKEIEDVLDMIKSALQARKDVIGSNINFIALSFKEAEQLLKLRAE